MTPPPVDAALLQRAARPTLSAPSSRTGRSRAAAVPPTEWCCDNCSHTNAARRRRCLDCGTSRY